MSKARDNANNWAADITAVSAGVGVTGGGTSGAVTVTNDMATTIDAKGDLVVGTGADTYVRVAVGSNNQVLTADSATTSGVKWATADAGFDSFLAPKITGEFLVPNWTGNRADQNPVQGTTYYHPIFLPGHTFDRIVARAGGGSGTATVRMGIYNSDATTKLPSTVYLDAGTATVSTWSANVEITINSTPPAGLYYIAINVQTVSVGNEWSGSNQAGYDFTMPYNFATVNGTFTRCLAQTGVTGAFATAGTITSGTIRLTCGLRMA